MDARLKYLVDPYIYYRQVANVPNSEFDAEDFIARHIRLARMTEYPQDLVQDVQQAGLIMDHVPITLFEKLTNTIRIRFQYIHNLNRWNEALIVNSGVIAYARDVCGLSELYSADEYANALELQLEYYRWIDFEISAVMKNIDILRDLEQWCKIYGGVA